MPTMKSYTSVDEYIEDAAAEVQTILKKMRQTIKKAAPDATETLAYGVPTFKLNGNLLHFGAFKKHIGFFPGPRAVVEFKKELEKYQTSKGTIQFQFTEPIPYDLVTKITEFRVKQNTEKKKATSMK